jgi:hypothetical protein
LEVAVPNCQAYQNEVDRLRDLLAEQTAECRQLDDPLEVRLCLQIRAAIAAQLGRAQDALENCQQGLPQPGVQRAQGRLNFLRVHDAGGFGPDSDHIDAEVVFKLDTHPDRAFGFQLRDDSSRPAHEGMLMLLRDAMAHDFDVATDYHQVLNRANSIAFRIELTNADRFDAGSVLLPLITRR